MKKFIIKISIFILYLLTINFLVFQFITKDFVFHDYLKHEKPILKKKPNVLILGDSHPMAIQQKFLDENVFNFSYHSESFFDMYIKLMFCLENEIPIKTLIFPAEDHDFSKYRMDMNNKKNSIAYSSYGSYTEFYEMNFFKYFFTKISYFFPYYIPLMDNNNSRRLERIFKRFWKDNFEKKFFSEKPKKISKKTKVKKKNKKKVWFDFSEEEKLKHAKSRFYRQFGKSIYQKKLHKCFDKIIKVCDENKIKIIGIKYPLTTCYNKLLKEKDFSKIDSIYKSKDFKIYDFRKKYLGRDELFRDQDHLNETKGAKLFSVELKKIIK